MKSLSKFLKCRGYITILLLIAVGLFFYLLSSYFLGKTCFGAALAQIAGAIGAQGLAKILIKVGFSSSLAFFLASALRAFFTTGVIEGNMMAPPNDEIVPSHSGSGGPSHSPSWKEDSFEIDVLLEESETEGTSARSSGAARDEAGPPRQDYINRSFEASMRNRILRLEQDDSPYLLGKAKGTYWSDIRLMLEHAPLRMNITGCWSLKTKISRSVSSSMSVSGFLRDS